MPKALLAVLATCLVGLLAACILAVLALGGHVYLEYRFERDFREAFGIPAPDHNDKEGIEFAQSVVDERLNSIYTEVFDHLTDNNTEKRNALRRKFFRDQELAVEAGLKPDHWQGDPPPPFFFSTSPPVNTHRVSREPPGSLCAF